MAGRNSIGLTLKGSLGVVVLTCAAILLGTSAAALASPPTVTIFSPLNGSVGNKTPEFSGLAEVGSGPVTLQVYSGTVAEGFEVEKQSTSLLTGEGGWAVRLHVPLVDGVYTAQASQTNSSEQKGSSPPVTFTINTLAPTVSLDQPEPLPGDMTPAFTGTASDHTPVIVEIESTEGTTVAVATAAGTGAAWRSSDATPALGVGQYTAVAFQESSIGNQEGISNAVTFTIQPALPPSGPAPPITAAAPAPPPKASVAATVASRPSLMQPFPVVRIAGVQTRTGVRLRLLRVQQMPGGAQVRVRCTGHGCPTRGLRRLTVPGPHGVAPLTLGAFQRSLGFGATLQIFISKPGTIGKYTRFTVRRGRLPERVDTCLDPTGVKPVVCPSS